MPPNGLPMPTRLFSSNRERWLWAAALAAVVAIYATLGLAARLAGELRNRGVIDNFVFLCFLLVIAAIVTQALKTRPRGAEIGVALGITAVYLLVFARMALPAEERTHLVEYGVVAVLIYAALLERASQGRHVPAPAVIAILVTAVLGILDECIQAFVPNRVFDPIDILFNVLAGLMAVVASLALGWARRTRLLRRGTP